jgi:hypothetical protein
MKHKIICVAIFYACQQIGRDYRDRQTIKAFAPGQPTP